MQLSRVIALKLLKRQEWGRRLPQLQARRRSAWSAVRPRRPLSRT